MGLMPVELEYLSAAKMKDAEHHVRQNNWLALLPADAPTDIRGAWEATLLRALRRIGIGRTQPRTLAAQAPDHV